MARKRTLRPEEAELWQLVARSTKSLHAEGKPAPAPIGNLPPALAPEPAPPKPPLPTFRLGEAARPSLPSPGPVKTPLRMDAKAYTRMTKGKLMPEARIDLHGMTLAEAHPELIRFILNAQSDALRLVLVITGKGSRIEGRAGALRREVPIWLRLPPLGPAVQQVAEAHQRHGGGGALYVYLRRR